MKKTENKEKVNGHLKTITTKMKVEYELTANGKVYVLHSPFDVFAKIEEFNIGHLDIEIDNRFLD